ncbi:MAG: shikimate kinase [Christensenellales bacterium]
MKDNITIVALNKRYRKNIAKKLANTLQMFYLDINELVKYELFDVKKVIKLSGLDYFSNEETKIVKSVSKYENTLCTLDLDTFFNNDNYKYLKEKNLIIFLKLNYDDFKLQLEKERLNNKYENLLELKVFDERNKVLEKLCDIVVDLSLNEKNYEDKIIEEIKKYYKDVL